MKLNCVEVNGVVAIDVEGRIVHGEIDTTKDMLKAALGEGVYGKKLLLNMSQTDFVDSAGVSWLLVCHKRCREAGGRLIIHSLTPMVRQVLAVLRLDQVFQLADDSARALRTSQGNNAMNDVETIDFKPADLNSADLVKQTPDMAVGELLDYASDLNASDLFFASNEKEVVVSIRHLGIIRSVARADLEQGRRWMLHIKALAGIPLDVRRRPNEGRWLRDHGDGRKTDLRISTIPTLHGEDFCIRLLQRESGLRKPEGLGLVRQQYSELLAMLNAAGGLILVTGPTASGKTTTLYACLQYLNDGRRKINTIEDPIEYAVDGIRQSQINPVMKVDFPELLRNVLRQSPDVIMIGEIRDQVTAQTAVRAANSGHLVFATLHAPTAAGAIQSMLNLDVHPHFFASCLRGVIAQRLVRTLCPKCKVAYDLSESPLTFGEVERWLEPGQGKQFYSAPGCPDCGQSGYTNRMGVFELLNATPGVRKQVTQSASTRDIERQAISEGMIEFRRSGLLKVAQGVTSTEEVIRIVPAEYLGVE